MTDKNLTDAEIKKALECCKCGTLNDCDGCPCFSDEDIDTARECAENLMSNALDLINRQKAELEKTENIIRIADKTIETAKAEIERLQKNLEEAHLDIKKQRAEKETYEARNKALKTERNRLNKEIKQLKVECGLAKFEKYKADFEEFKEEIKAEAYKEFAERLKTEYNDFDEENEVILPENIFKAIDDLLKELVGEDNASKD